jgi:hypothetical protein
MAESEPVDVTNGKALVRVADQVWELRTRAYTEAQIAKELNLNMKTVRRLLRKRGQREARRFEGRKDEQKVVSTEVLWEVVHSACRAWERSIGPQKRAWSRTYKDATGQVQAVVAHADAYESPGNPKFLAQAESAIVKILVIWGIYLPGPHVKPNGQIPNLPEIMAKVKAARDAYEREQASGTAAPT